MLTKTKLALALTGLLVGGVAAAEGFHGDRGPGPDLIQKYDTNKDGKLDDSERAAMRADFQARREERKKEALAKYDANKDGKLDETERKVMRDDRIVERFKKLDVNGDGQISLDEFKKGHADDKGFQHRHGPRGMRGMFRGPHTK